MALTNDFLSCKSKGERVCKPFLAPPSPKALTLNEKERESLLRLQHTRAADAENGNCWTQFWRLPPPANPEIATTTATKGRG